MMIHVLVNLLGTHEARLFPWSGTKEWYYCQVKDINRKWKVTEEVVWTSMNSTLINILIVMFLVHEVIIFYVTEMRP